MKLNVLLSTCINKASFLVGASCVYMGTASASLLPFTTQPHHVYNIGLPQTPGVTYASIDAKATDKTVFVKWVTATEMENNHFEVERSMDMKNFRTVALILDGFEAEGTGKSYQFKEEAGEVKNGKTVYYRLKQFDNDGKVSYSTVLAVKLDSKSTGSSMQLFPNPSENRLAVQLTANAQGSAEIRIVNLSGQTRLSKQSTISKGTSTFQLDGLNKLEPGIYMAQLIMNGVVIDNQKLIKE